MPAVFDFKKVDKEFYTAKPEPEEIRVPPMKFISARGKGQPGGEAFNAGVEAVTMLSQIIKLSKNKGHPIAGYYDYRLAPLESHFWGDIGRKDLKIPRKKWLWCCMVRQPDFVEDGDFQWAMKEYRAKNPDVDLDASRVQFWSYTEGYCVQMLHVGPRTRETAAIKKMKAYMDAHQMVETRYQIRKHHEIYLNDAGRTDPEKLKTILRLPVANRY
jgi:hypothetical protein